MGEEPKKKSLTSEVHGGGEWNKTTPLRRITGFGLLLPGPEIKKNREKTSLVLG